MASVVPAAVSDSSAALSPAASSATSSAASCTSAAASSPAGCPQPVTAAANNRIIDRVNGIDSFRFITFLLTLHRKQTRTLQSSVGRKAKDRINRREEE